MMIESRKVDFSVEGFPIQYVTVLNSKKGESQPRIIMI